MKPPRPVMRLPISRRTAVWAAALTAAGGLFAVPASAAQQGPDAVVARDAAAQPCEVTLPGGAKATVTAQGSHLSDPASAREDVIGYRSGGDQYLVPVSALSHAARTGLAAYDTSALARHACGDRAPEAPAAAPAGKPADYRMGRLTAHMVNADGKTATQGEFFLINADHTAYADEFYGVFNGTLKLSVPTGHYMAVFVDTLNGGERLTVSPEITVADGTAVTLDSRTATHRAPVPATPRPATLTSTEVSLYRSDGTAGGDATGPVLQIQRTGATPADVTLNTTAPVSRGRFEAVTTFDLASPAGTAQPYAYHVANSFTHLPAAYPATLGATATVRRTYTDPTGQGDPGVLINNVTPLWAARAGVQTATGIEDLTLGTTRTEYVSSSPDLNWRSQVLDEQTFALLSGPDAVYRPGQQLTEDWQAGAPHPSVQLDSGNAAVYCGACADEDNMVFAIGSDGDTTPGTIGLPGTETDAVTLKRNGDVLATGSAGLWEASVPVPTGRARYELEQLTTRSAEGLSPTTDTTWTFTADPGHGPALPSRVHCAGPVDGSCAALPLLYAAAKTDADTANRLAPGRHTVDLSVTRQQFATAPQVSGATLQASFDGGTTWQDLRLAGSRGAYEAQLTVPASASGGSVSFRLSAWDGQGNRIDQTLADAYGVR